jgi:hypothetical protein
MSLKSDIVALALGGVAVKEIAARLQTTPKTVYNYVWAARRDGAAIPGGRPGPAVGSVRFYLAGPNGPALRDHAARRGVEPSTLAVMILSRVIEDNLIAAVLDDAEDAA